MRTQRTLSSRLEPAFRCTSLVTRRGEGRTPHSVMTRRGAGALEVPIQSTRLNVRYCDRIVNLGWEGQRRKSNVARPPR